MKKEDVKPQVKAIAKQFTKEYVSQVTRESTKKLIRGLKKEKKAALEEELKNLSAEEVEKCLRMKPEFNKAFENTIESIKEASLEKIQLVFEENFSTCLPPAPASFVGKKISWIKQPGHLGLIGAASLVIILAVMFFALPIAAPYPDDNIEGWSNVNSPTFRWSEPDSIVGIAGYYYRVDDGSESYSATTSVKLPEQKDGTHTFYVRAKDNSGNIGSQGSHQFNIDTSGPSAPNPDDDASGWISDNTPSFNWNPSSDISGISGYYYRVDDGSEVWTTSTSVELMPQTEGTHTFYVMAKDTAGNIGPYGTHQFNIDTVNPYAPFPDDGVSGWSNNNKPSFRWSDPGHLSGIAGYYYRVDSGSETYTTSTTVTLPQQTDGTHTFYVRAKDNAGHIGPEGSHQFSIDTANPPAPIPDDGVSGWSKNNKPSFWWPAPGDISGIAGYYYKVDSGPETYTTSTSITLPQQTDGAHTFYVRTKDNAGNAGSYGTHQFSIDATNPLAPSPDDGVDDWTNDNTPRFTWYIRSGDTSDINGYYYMVDSGPESFTTSTSVILPQQTDGTHTFYVRAKDNADNIGSYGSHQFNIDTNPPGTFKITQVSLKFSWNPPNDLSLISGYYYKVDNGPEYWITSPSVTLSSLSETTHTLWVRAKDNAGNIGSYSSLNFYIIN